MRLADAKLRDQVVEKIREFERVRNDAKKIVMFEHELPRVRYYWGIMDTSEKIIKSLRELL